MIGWRRINAEREADKEDRKREDGGKEKPRVQNMMKDKVQRIVKKRNKGETLILCIGTGKENTSFTTSSY